MRGIGWLTACAMWGCMFYALSTVYPLAKRQGYSLAQHSKPDAEYRLTLAEGIQLSAEQYDGRMRIAGGRESIVWQQGGRRAKLEWAVVRRTGGFIPNGEPVRVRFYELRAPLKAGMTIRMVRMGLPTGYYFVFLDERGEAIGVLEVFWNT